MTKHLLVTGANGQLGYELKQLVGSLPQFDFLFTGSQELDIANADAVNRFFDSGRQIDFCINAAAYTAVDKAESDARRAHQVNAEGAAHLARACREHGAVLLHVSTDFVFDGEKNRPYEEFDAARPLSVYGQSKLAGERAVLETHPLSLVVRTSWLYSAHGHNFMKTMLRLGRERELVRVVSDQIGTPTYARDLAAALLHMVEHLSEAYQANGAWQGVNGLEEIYHYSNEGAASWYDFAHAVFDIAQLPARLEPIPTSGYPTPAVRPPYSLLDKRKIKAVFGLQIPHWRDSLRECIGATLV